MAQLTIDDLRPDPNNRRSHTVRNLEMVTAALQAVGAARSIVIDEENCILAGNGVSEAAKAAGIDRVQIVESDGSSLVAVRRRGLTPEQKRALAIYDNRTAELAEWNLEQLAADLQNGEDLTAFFLPDELAALFPPEMSEAEARTTLAERFGVPPFSVLDARQGYWQDRKRAWLALGIRSALGRTVTGVARTTGVNSAMNRLSGRLAVGGDDNDGSHVASIFDPVLCELAYRWFCPPAGLVLDPFAGGSVRGIVASRLGRAYTGIDLSAPQVAANEAQATKICEGAQPRWIVGDSRKLPTLCKGLEVDLVFSCPPYADLERYSSDPRDLSTMAYAEFITAYRAIIKAACACLRPDRFACFVVGDLRGPRGFYRGFVSDTASAFADAGAALYNEAILVTAIASLPLRVAKQFEGARKLGKTHQNVLVFCKGDPKRATAAIGPVEAGVEP